MDADRDGYGDGFEDYVATEDGRTAEEIGDD